MAIYRTGAYITTYRILDAQVLSADIGSGQIGGNHLAQTGMVGEGTILSAHIASGQIGGHHIASGGVISANIASGAIGARHIASGGVIAANVASGTLTGSKIAAATVVSANIASGQIYRFHISSGGVFSANIASGQIGGHHIASGGVISANIASGQVAGHHIASGGVISANIASGQIGGSHVGLVGIPPEALQQPTSSHIGALAGGLRVARGYWDYTSGASLAATPITQGEKIPANAIVLGGWLDVEVACGGGTGGNDGSGTIALSVEGANDLVTATACIAAPFSGVGRSALVPAFTGDTMIKTTQARDISLTVAEQAVISGRIQAYVVYAVTQ